MKTSLLCVKGMINIEVFLKTNWQGYDLLFITSRDDLLSITSVFSHHFTTLLHLRVSVSTLCCLRLLTEH